MIKTEGKIIKRKIIDDKFLLWIEPKTKINFLPGQFVNIEYNGIARSYSIASLPEEKELLFYIKRVRNGKLSNTLYSLPIGTMVRIYGPFGILTPDRFKENRVVFIVNGTGIAPVRPLAYSLKNKKEIYIIHQERYEKYLVFKEEFEKIANYYPILSKEEKTKYLRGHVQDYIDDFIFKNTDYVLIGSASFVKDIYELLLKKGIKKENIHLESFGNI